MSENKTKPEATKVSDFLATVKDPQKHADSLELIKLHEELTGKQAVMWGPSIIGFGQYHYKYASGREGDGPLAGFSPRKPSMTVYLAQNFDQKEELLKKLGKHTVSVSCLYFKKLDDIDRDVLRQMIQNSIKATYEMYEVKP